MVKGLLEGDAIFAVYNDAPKAETERNQFLFLLVFFFFFSFFLSIPCVGVCHRATTYTRERQCLMETRWTVVSQAAPKFLIQ